MTRATLTARKRACRWRVAQRASGCTVAMPLCASKPVMLHSLVVLAAIGYRAALARNADAPAPRRGGAR